MFLFVWGIAKGASFKIQEFHTTQFPSFLLVCTLREKKDPKQMSGKNTQASDCCVSLVWNVVKPLTPGVFWDPAVLLDFKVCQSLCLEFPTFTLFLWLKLKFCFFSGRTPWLEAYTWKDNEQCLVLIKQTINTARSPRRGLTYGDQVDSEGLVSVLCFLSCATISLWQSTHCHRGQRTEGPY